MTTSTSVGISLGLTAGICVTVFGTLLISVLQSSYDIVLDMNMSVNHGQSYAEFPMRRWLYFRTSDVAGTLAILCVFLAIVVAVFRLVFHRVGEKKWLAGCVLALIPLAILLHIQTYFSVAGYSYALAVARFYWETDASFYQTVHSDECGQVDVQFNLNSQYVDDIGSAGGFLVCAVVAYLFTVSSLAYHYLFVSTLEGPALSEYVWQFVQAVIGTSKSGLKLVTHSLAKQPLVSVRRTGDAFYRDIEFDKWTIHSLKDAIADHFGVIADDISRLIKNTDVLLETDNQVARITPTDRVEFFLHQDDESVGVPQSKRVGLTNINKGDSILHTGLEAEFRLSDDDEDNVYG